MIKYFRGYSVHNGYFNKDQLVKKFLLITSIYLFIISIACFLIYQPLIAEIIMSFSISLLFIRTFFSKKIIGINMATQFPMLLAIFCVLPVCVYYTGGLYSPIIWWFIVIPVASLLLFGIGIKTTFYIILSIVFLLVFAVLDARGIPFPSLKRSMLNPGISVSGIGLLGIIFNLTWIFETQKFEAYEQLNKEQELLKISEAGFRDIFENTEELIQNVQLDNGRFLYVNPAWLMAMEYSADEVEHISFKDIVHPESMTHCMDLFDKMCQGIVVQNMQATFITKTGKKIFVEGQAGCVMKNGKPFSTRGLFKNISAKKTAEEKILKSERAFEEAQELAQIGSWELNFFDNVPAWSKEMFKIFELEDTPTALVYETFRKKIHRADSPVVDEFIKNIFEKQIVTSIEVRIQDRNNSTKYINILGQPLTTKRSGKVIGVRGTAQDITKQKIAALAKSNFLSTMSHEIRTPINGVIGITNLLMDEDLTESQKEYVDILNFSSQQLLTIVSDILDFSKIEAGNFTFEKVSFNMEQVCSNTFKLFKTKATEKGLNYTFKPCDIQSFSLYGDYVRLGQILSNLLSNAVKFTESGNVELSYTILSETENNIELQFSVKDSGIGIPQSFQKKIFDSFSQADETVTRQYGGTGLGLTISKKLVELQGGSIKVESVHGKGSVFSTILTFDKHIYPINNELAAENIIRQKNDSLEGMKILVAEDNSINAMVIIRFLQKWHIESKLVGNGRDAVDIVEKESFDLVLMDLQMPLLDGREATKKIRESADEKIKRINIIALTADALIDSRRSLLKNGFDDCVTKPFNPDDLFKTLQKYYRK